VTLADVLDETFCGTDPGLEPVRAGFWRFDDHRGAPAPHVTGDHATNPFEIAAVVATGAAIAATPASNATHALRALTNVVAIPVVDADPAVLSLAWHKDKESPLIEALVATARRLRGECPGGEASGGGASNSVPSAARGTVRSAGRAVSGS
jgi:DNA-binding transcriptional LysR family regulator